MTRFNLRKHFAPVSVILLGLLGLAGCKLTSNGGGGNNPPPSGSTEYLFATSDNQIWSYKVDATTGALSTPASITGPGLSEGIVADPAGNFLYVADTVNDQVHVYSISTSGTLTQIAGSPYTVGAALVGFDTAAGLAMDSAGKFLYAADFGNDTVAAFTVNSSTGALSAVAGSPFTASTSPVQVVVDSTGKFVYAADFNSVLGGISAFTLNSTSGALTPVPGSSPFTTVLNGSPLGMVTTGQFVYVAEQSSNHLFGLSINSTTGGLSTLPSSPFTTGTAPTGLALTPSAKYLYVANSQSSNISGYSVNSTNGALTAISGSPFAATSAPWYLTVDPSGKFLYATNPSDDSITGFTINTSSGALTQFSGSATSAGTRPVSLIVVTVQ